MACLSENTILEFLQGNPDAGEVVHAHIDTCPRCRELLSNLARSSMAVPAPLDDEPTDPEASVDPSLPSNFLAARFRIVAVLGKGSMGTVYHASDLSLGIDVAIKVLHPEVEAAPAVLRQLHREILTSRRISHPNVRRVYDLGEADGRHFISMEYIEGETLTTRLARGQPSVTEALHILDQMCAALEAAHREDVVHRDLKPSNVMIDRDNRVKVMDFGLARDLSRDATINGAAIGTPAYWSPEQSRGEHATPQSDIYALGVVMCDLLCEERTGHHMARAETLHPSLRPIAVRCLAPNPADRFASAAEMRRALASVRDPNRGRVVRRAVVGGILAASSIAGLWLFAATRAETPTPPPAPQRATVPVNEGALTPEPPKPVVEPTSTVRQSAHTTPVGRPGKKRPASRKRRAAHAPKPPRETDASASNEPPAEVDANAAAVAKELADRLANLQASRVTRGLLVSDLEGWRNLVRAAEAAITAGDRSRSDEALDSLERLANRPIDEPFIQEKVARISGLARSGTHPEADRLADVLGRVHKAYFAGQYEQANKLLNEMWHLLHSGG